MLCANRFTSPMRPDQIPDFVLPLSVVANDYRVVYEPEAVLREDALTEGGAEFRMRVRVTLRSLWALRDMRRLFNPFRYGLFAFQIFSHKLLRYTAFLPLLVLMPLNIALVQEGSSTHSHSRRKSCSICSRWPAVSDSPIPESVRCHGISCW